jgi:hypothetical protein
MDMRLLKRGAGVGFVALLIAACGGSSGQKVTIDATPAALRKSAESTLSKGTAKLELTMQLSIEGQDVTLRGSGAFDQPNRRLQLDLDLKDFAKLGSGASTPPGVAEAFNEPMTEILDGTVLYMRFPLLAKSPAAEGKPWIKFDLAAANKSVGDLLGSGGGGAFGSDPTAFLQFLEGAGKVAKVGTEQVRGVNTTHLSGSYTLNDALASLPDDQRQKVEQTFSGLGLPDSARSTEIPFDAWVGDDGLVRRVQTSIDPSTFATNTKVPPGKVSVSMDLFDFGTPVDITIPSDDEVRDLSSLAASASSKFSSVQSSIGN